MELINYTPMKMQAPLKTNSTDPSPKHQITSRNIQNPNAKLRTICYICGKDYVGIVTHIRLAHPKTNPQQATNS